MTQVVRPRQRRLAQRLGDPISPRSVPLWLGVVAPPVAWGAHLILGDLIFELGCAPAIRGRDILGLQLQAWAVIQSVATAAVCAVAGVLAYRAWRELRRIPHGATWDRAHAFAVAGVASSIIYLLLIAYGVAGTFFLEPCTPPP